MFAFALFYNVIECRAQIRDFRYIYILLASYSIVERGRRGRDRMVPVLSMAITTNVVGSNPVQARCTRYNIM